MYKIYHEDISDSAPLLFICNPSVYIRSTIVDCDYILHNRLISHKKNRTYVPSGDLSKISEKYIAANKFVIIFILSDYEKRYTFHRNLIIVRTSLKQSLKRENELTMPYIWECLTLPFSPIKSTLPAVGFCGLLSKYRKKIMAVFNNSTDVRTDFIIRDKFWGGEPHNEKLINEYNDNLQKNPFIISQRGTGNFSMRFYQVLAAGRIPVLVNTDMLLPFSEEIEWDKIVIFEKDAETCLKKVIEVFGSGAYIKMQENCRRVFDDYFSNTNFFPQLIKQIDKISINKVTLMEKIRLVIQKYL